MAVPKSRTSKSKRDKRRAHDGLRAPAQAACPDCGAPRLPHRICPSCGNYNGRNVVATEED